MLLTGGVVYTLRRQRRSGRNVAVQGSLNKYHILADVMVTEVKPINASWELLPYLPQSGLDNVDMWLAIAKSFYPVGTQLYLYEVKLIRRRGYGI